MVSVRPARLPADCPMWQKLVAIFPDTVNVINVKLCMTVVLIEFYSVIPLSVILIVLQRHIFVRQF